MEAYFPPPSFKSAADFLSRSTSVKTSTATKLELYGLYKFVTVNTAPDVSRPLIFDMTGRAKWDAWASAESAYRGRLDDAVVRYQEIARSLGWVEGEDARSEKPGAVDGSEDIWDEEGEPSRGQTGMGFKVSIMARGEDEVGDSTGDGSLHGLAVAGDVERLSALLQRTSSGVDIDAKDEFGYTPLHLACDRGSLAVAEALIRGGADATILDPDDFTALELARVAGHEDVASAVEKAIGEKLSF